MKPRRGVLALFAAVLLIWLGFSMTWHFLDLDQKIIRKVELTLVDAGCTEVRIETLTTGLLRLDFESLQFLDPTEKLKLRVESVSLQFSPMSFLISGGDFLKGVHSIEFNSPEIHLLPGAFSSNSAKEDDSSGIRQLQNFLSNQTILSSWMNRLPAISLRDGSIYFGAVNGKETDVEYLALDEFQGIVTMRPDELVLLLNSRILEGENRGLNLELSIDPDSLNGQFKLDMTELTFDRNLMREYFNVNDGRLNFTLNAGGVFSNGKLDSLGGTGNLAIDNLLFGKSLEAVDGSCNLELSSSSLSLSAGNLGWGGVELGFNGNFGLPDSSKIIRIRGNGIDLQQVNSLLGLDEKLEASVGLSVDIRFPEGSPSLDLSATLDSLQYTGLALGDLGFNASFQAGLLKLDSLKWLASDADSNLVHSVDLTADGEFVLHKNHFPAGQLRVDADIELDNYIQNDSFKSGIELALASTVDFDSLQIGGDSEIQIEDWIDKAQVLIDLDLLRGQAPLMFAQGTYYENELNLSLTDPQNNFDGLLAATLINDSADWFVSLNDGHLLIDQLLEEGLPAARNVSSSLEANGDLFAAEFKIAADQNRMQMLARGDLAFEEQLSLSAALLLHDAKDSLEADLRLRYHENKLMLDEFEIQQEMFVSGWLDFKKQQYMLDLESLDLRLGPLLSVLKEEKLNYDPGLLNIWMAGEGDLDSPGIRGGIEYSTKSFGLPAWLRAEIEIDESKLRIPAGNLSLAGADIGKIELNADLLTGSGRGVLDVGGVQIGEIYAHYAKLAANERTKNSGKAVFSGLLAGLAEVSWNPDEDMQVQADMHIDKPILAGRSFDRFDLGISNDSATGGLMLDSLVLQRQTDPPLKMTISGNLPFANKEMELGLDLEGNLLWPLTVKADGQRSTFFKEAVGFGNLNLRVGGTADDLVLSEGSLHIASGTMGMESIFRKVKDINIDLSINNRRLDINRLDALVGKGRMRIGNTHDIYSLPEELQPIVFDFPELDLGVLLLETMNKAENKGPIPLVIPGMMEPGWDAEITIAGQNSAEDFYFSGPLDRPIVRGRALANSSRFTFPFIKSEKEPTQLLLNTIEFINSIEWDLEVAAGRNCSYYRKLQGFEGSRLAGRLEGFLDRITIDVTLDPSQEPLIFSGQIEDESFRLSGEVTSSKGSVTYLEKDFAVEDAGMVFDNSTLLPVLWGTASHFVYADDQLSHQMSSLLDPGTRQVYLQFVAQDELGNQTNRGRWDEISLQLLDDLGSRQQQFQTSQEEILEEMGFDPYDISSTLERVLPGVVAGMWEIPLGPLESRIRRELHLDLVRIYIPVIRNTAEELLETQTRQQRISQSYMSYLQGSRLILGKSLSKRYFALWTGQLVSSAPGETRDEIMFYQRMNIEYELNKNLKLTGELVFDPSRETSRYRADPRLMLRYRLKY
jgi:hypothetical protein